MIAFSSFPSRYLWRVSPACRSLVTRKRPCLFRGLSSDGKTAANLTRESVEEGTAEERPHERRTRPGRVRRRGRRDYKNAYPDLGESGTLRESQTSFNLSKLMDSLRSRTESHPVVPTQSSVVDTGGEKVPSGEELEIEPVSAVPAGNPEADDKPAFSELLNKAKSPDSLSKQEGVSGDDVVFTEEVSPAEDKGREEEDNERGHIKGTARFGQPPEFEADPELASRVKNILSELKVEASNKGLAKGIVGAVRNWGKSHPRHREDLLQEYMSQERESFDEGPTVSVDFKFGPKLSLFNAAVAEGPSEDVTHKPFLMEMDKGDRIDQLVLADARRNDFEDLVAVSNRQWKFPVDNEVCKVDEADVGFEEHTFLQYLLDEFPDTGPVRRFMELVINGLEQNPHLSVKAKKEQVFWFKEYFSNFSEEDLNF